MESTQTMASKKSGANGSDRASALKGNTPSSTPASRLLRTRSEEHTSELQSRSDLVCRLLLEKKKKKHKDRGVAHAEKILDLEGLVELEQQGQSKTCGGTKPDHHTGEGRLHSLHLEHQTSQC